MNLQQILQMFQMIIFTVGVELQSGLWRKQEISTTKFYINQIISAIDLRECLRQCKSLDWCNLACFEKNENICSHSITIISGKYKEDQTDGKLVLCYTDKTLNLMIGATVSVSDLSINSPERAPANLEDGYYNFDINTCTITKLVTNPWLQVDLSQIFLIREISFMCQPNNVAQKHCQLFTVLVGKTSRVARMKFFGYFEGPGHANQSVTLRSNPPISAQFIRIQKNHTGYLQICHIEVRGDP